MKQLNSLYTSDVTNDHKEIMFQMALTQKQRFKDAKSNAGHSIYCMNINTGEIYLADYKTTVETGKFAKYKTFHLEQKLDHLYIWSLNLDNAVKKFSKRLYAVKYTVAMAKLRQQQESSASTSFPLRGDVSIDKDKPINNTENANAVHD